MKRSLELGRIGERYREFGARLTRSHTMGPFAFCDYWASVLSLRGVVNPGLLARRLVSLDVFRQALDRPKARLPRLRYYLLAFIAGPGFLPYRLAFNLAMLLRPKSGVKIVGHADVLLDEYQLELRPLGDPRWVRVSARGETLAEPVLNPRYARAENGIFYPTYKILVAAFFTVIFTLVVFPALAREPGLAWLRPYHGILSYPVVVIFLELLLRDLLTSIVAPLPVFAVKGLLGLTHSSWGFVGGMVGAGLLFFLVEWFFIPRGLPPSLFLYVNEPGHPLDPYLPGHAPYWLTGRTYWVWRFVALAPSEINKFWEKDWERLELWVRADPGPEAGRLEWMVTDAHYREIWFSYEHVVGERTRRRHELRREELLVRDCEPLVWIVETDMHFVNHAPEIRSVFLSSLRPSLGERPLFRILRTFVSPRRRDSFRKYEAEVERIEVDTGEFLNDITEHFRGWTVRHMFRMPWSYWRYPKGVRTRARLYLYDGERFAESEVAGASDPRYQIKAIMEEAARERLARRGAGGAPLRAPRVPVPRAGTPAPAPGAGSAVEGAFHAGAGERGPETTHE